MKVAVIRQDTACGPATNLIHTDLFIVVSLEERECFLEWHSRRKPPQELSATNNGRKRRQVSTAVSSRKSLLEAYTTFNS